MMMMMMMMIIIIIHVFGAINCFLHSTRAGANILGPEVPGEFFYLMDGNLLSSRRMIFCSSLMLPAPGIFPKFWFIPSLISPSAPTKSAQSLPSFPTFSWFQSQDLCILRAFQWLSSRCFSRMVPIHLSVCNTGWYVLDHHIRLVRWQFPIRMYLYIQENCDFFFFGNRLGLVFIPHLWDFNTVMLAGPPMDICSCLIVPL